jgi:hypothetical protein
VERKDPGTGAWVPVSVTGQRCDQGTEVSTDAAGAFTRLSPYQGDATYRMTVRQPETYLTVIFPVMPGWIVHL